jgi:hypothetical protein
MAGTYDIPRYKSGDKLHAKTVNQLTDEVRKFNRVRTGSGLVARMGPGGLAMGVVFPETGKVARAGPSGIPARTGTTLGSGDVTLYDIGDDGELAEGPEDTAYNLATGDEGAVAGDAFIQVKRVDGKWLVDWEHCSSS